MRTQYDVTVCCGGCHQQWNTWGIPWSEPTVNEFPGGDWILGKSVCPTCDDESYVLVKHINSELGAPEEHPSLTIGERNA